MKGEIQRFILQPSGSNKFLLCLMRGCKPYLEGIVREQKKLCVLDAQ